MNKIRNTLLSLLLFAPLTAFAHGEEVLLTVFLEVIVLLTLVVGLFQLNFSGKGKMIIGALYCITIILTFMATNRLPYNQYRALINIVVVTAPLTVGVLSYIGLRKRFQKK